MVDLDAQPVGSVFIGCWPTDRGGDPGGGVVGGQRSPRDRGRGGRVRGEQRGERVVSRLGLGSRRAAVGRGWVEGDRAGVSVGEPVPVRRVDHQRAAARRAGVGGEHDRVSVTGEAVDRDRVGADPHARPAARPGPAGRRWRGRGSSSASPRS